MADWSAALRPTSKRLLEALVEGPKSLSQLAEGTGFKKPSLLPHLADLSDLGLVAREERRADSRREVFYRLTEASLHMEIMPGGAGVLAWASIGSVPRDFPLLAQIRDPAERGEVHHALQCIRRALEAHAEWPRLAIVLFGSMARGEAGRKSDIDLLILTRRKLAARYYERTLDALADAQEALEHPARAQFGILDGFLVGATVIDEEAARDGIIIYDSGGDGALWRRMQRYKSISI